MEAARKELVEKARQKDADAFAALIRNYERMALSVAYGVLGDATAAGDVVQDAFIRAWQRLADLREPERFGTWVCGIVRNLAIDALRRRKPTDVLGVSNVVQDPERWTVNPMDEVDRREKSRKVAEAIASLDEASRLVVTMRYYEDLSSKEIAERLEMTPAAVDMRLSRARKVLKAMLEDEPHAQIA
jgi:RNA polymerase sigma-70 factor (ECF subfamily)